MTVIACPIYDHAMSSPDALAVVSGETILSYAMLHTQLMATQAVLVGNGLKRGDVFCLISDSPLSHIRYFWACLREGMIYCPINPKFPQEFIDQLIAIVVPKKIVIETLHQCDTSLALDKRHISQEQVSLTMSVSQPASLVFTSGSSGTPKAVLNSVHNYMVSAKASHTRLHITARSSWLLSLPCYHISGLSILVRMFLAGGLVHVPKQGPLSEAIQCASPTHVSLVLPQLKQCLQDNSSLLTSLSCILLGGSGVPEPVLQQAVDLGLPLYYSYGLTEHCSQVCTTRITSLTHDFAGIPLFPDNVTLSNDNELLIRGDCLFLGYYSKGLIVLPLDKEGWFHTGDLAEKTDGNTYKIIGRKDRQFVSGGENINPEIIEKALLSLDSLQKVKVIPMDHPEFGQVVSAHIYPFDESALPGIREALRTRLPNFMHPKAYFKLEPLLDSIK